MTIDRRQAIRDYKDTPRTMGVGCVRNVQTGAWLVFSGVDIPALVNRHRAQLRLGAHRTRQLQQEWQSFGESAFTFDILDTLEPPKDAPDYDPAADLATLEKLWIDKLSSAGERYQR